MHINNNTDEVVEVKMPVWAPGSYLVRDFSKNVNLVKAFDENGKALKVEKTRKNAWNITKGSAKSIVVKYEVYAFELTVRTSFLDLTHGFVSGSGVFMYVEKMKNDAGEITVVPHSSFSKVTTSLKQIGESVVNDGSYKYTYKHYDELADCPIEIGNQEIFEFTASGCKHTVAMYGPANYDVEKLKVDMAKIVEASTSIFGENPNDHYVFIIHNVTDGQGGLEHMNSTTLSVSRETYSPENYNKFLTLVAHEYFHLWNVKRIRAKELGPFNYDEEVYTPLLYVMEGFTSYYEDLIVYKAGFLTDEQYVGILQAAVNYVEGTVGSRVQPLSHASMDAWIKAYKPNENSVNTTMTYYSRGGMIASLLDAMIIDKFNGEKNLDDFMKLLYQNYYKAKDVGFTNAEFEGDFSKFMGEDMSWFFNKYVHDVEIPDYEKIFSKVGITVENTTKPVADFGAVINKNGMVRSVRSNSPAEKAGVSVNDFIIEVNGKKVDLDKVSDVIKGFSKKDKFSLNVVRDGILMKLEGKMEEYEKMSFKFGIAKKAEANPKFKAYLRK